MSNETPDSVRGDEVAAGSSIPAYRTVTDQDELRQHLDDLNEAGIHPVAVGVTSDNLPFLIALVGPYVEGEDVIFDSPWQRDADYGERQADGTWVPLPPRCDECCAHVHGMEHLRFPVTVVVPSSE